MFGAFVHSNLYVALVQYLNLSYLLFLLYSHCCTVYWLYGQ